MLRPLVSIIVPVYNVAKCLNRCLDSIRSQVYSDFEVLLIDDGSIDGSGQICDYYVSIDDRFSVTHKRNGGASSSRNVGLQLAKGEYITFIDSDDSVDDNWLIDLVDGIGDSDLCIVGHKRYEINRECPYYNEVDDRIITKDHYKDAIFILFNANQLGYLWSMLFRSDIVEKNSVRFNENVSFQEDLDFILRYLLHTQSFNTTNSTAYNYYYKKKKYKQSLEGICSIVSSFSLLLDEKSMKPIRKLYGNFALLTIIDCLDNEYIESVRSFMKKNNGYRCGYYSQLIFFAINYCPKNIENLLLRFVKYIRG